MLLSSLGVTHWERDRATPGLTLYSRNYSQRVRLVDMEGALVHAWDVTGRSTNGCYLLENGNLWMNEKGPQPGAMQAGAGGYLREYDWGGRIVWEHRDDFHHHDGRRLSNGGAVYLAWELLSDDQAARVQGGIPCSEHSKGIWGEVVREVDAVGRIVWEWRSATLIDQYAIHRNAPRAEYGHANTLSVLPGGDYLVSFKNLNLLVIVSRAMGEVTWSYQSDTLSGQHDAQMTEAGTILVFANGLYNSDLLHSKVLEIDPTTHEVVWTYTQRDNPMAFFSPHISGCQRLSSGNTLICEGAKGCLFEVTPEGDVVWEFVSPDWGSHPKFGPMNWVFRARRYAVDGPEIRNRI